MTSAKGEEIRGQIGVQIGPNMANRALFEGKKLPGTNKAEGNRGEKEIDAEYPCILGGKTGRPPERESHCALALTYVVRLMTSSNVC